MLNLSEAFRTFPVLETERLLLRAITPADAAAMFEIMSDPRVTLYFGRPPMTGIAESVARQHEIEADFQNKTGIRWAIVERTEHRLVGTAGFWRLMVPHGRAEIGYELGPAWWGRGVMSEALGAILGWGFAVLGLHSVEAQIDPANRASRRVLEKLGFVQEGYFRENYYEPALGHFTDTVVFSLLTSH